jgi:hypothetical protein
MKACKAHELNLSSVVRFFSFDPTFNQGLDICIGVPICHKNTFHAIRSVWRQLERTHRNKKNSTPGPQAHPWGFLRDNHDAARRSNSSKARATVSGSTSLRTRAASKSDRMSSIESASAAEDRFGWRTIDGGAEG